MIMNTRTTSLRARVGGTLACTAALLFAVLYAVNPAALRAQGMSPKRVPGLKKIESSGATRGVFTGGVQLLDLHSKVLEVSAADGASTAIFPINKKVKVASIEGRKLKLAALTPGTSVIVRYQQEGGRRTVQQITVVKKATSTSASKKPSGGR